MRKIRIGCGAGYGGDRLDPALTLLEQGDLDYIGFECLAERTIALAQKEKKEDPSKGYNSLLQYRMEKVLPLAFENQVKVITNMGAANPLGALDLIHDLAEDKGLSGLKIAAVTGDDIFDNIDAYYDQPTLETGRLLQELQDKLVSANAYLGIGPILEALKSDADIIVTGRVADPALFLAPMVHEFGWSHTDFKKLGKGTLVGHLLECAGQITGGYFADPGKKEVPELWNLGFPFVEVNESGQGIISKVDGTGGVINRATCTEQMLYEIHDPANYITPDCVADFSNVQFEKVSENRIAFGGASGSEATDSYKVSVGYHNGYFGEGEISYGGPNCVKRAHLAGDILKKRISKQQIEIEDIRYNLIGVDSLFPFEDINPGNTNEVRLRVAARTKSRIDAQRIGNEVETLYTNGPAGGGGASKRVDEVISVASILIPKSDIQPQVVCKEIS